MANERCVCWSMCESAVGEEKIDLCTSFGEYDIALGLEIPVAFVVHVFGILVGKVGNWHENIEAVTLFDSTGDTFCCSYTGLLTTFDAVSAKEARRRASSWLELDPDLFLTTSTPSSLVFFEREYDG